MLLVTLLVTGSFNAWADTVVTFTAGTDLGTTSASGSSDEMSKGGVTISSTNAAFATAEYRCYASSTMTISSTSTITKIVCALSSTKYSFANMNLPATEAGHLSNGTWTGESTSIKFSFNAQVRLKSIEVTLADAGTTPSEPTEKEDGLFDFDGISTTLAYGASYELVEDQDYLTDGVITLVSSNESVLSVEGKAFTAVGVGTATISATAAEGNTYKAITIPDTITITVTAPEGKTTAPTESEAFYESFDKCDGTGGNDGSWGGSIASTALTEAKCDKTGWTFNHGNAADKCAKFGASKTTGYAITPALGIEGNATLTFKAATWSGDGTSLEVKVMNGNDSTDIATLALVDSIFTDYTYNLSGLTATSKIKFDTNAKKHRFFLDEVKVTVAGVSTASATIAASGYGSFCCEYPLDFTTTSGYKAYYVSAVNGDAVTFTQITGKVKGGVPVILYGTPGTYSIPTTDSENEPEDYYLRGTLAPTYVEGTESDGSKNYGLSNGEFRLINDGMVKAGKAYLNVPAGTNASSRLRIVMPEATGISTLAADNAKAETFNLQGQRVERPAKGIYIVNGKKFINK